MTHYQEATLLLVPVGSRWFPWLPRAVPGGEVRCAGAEASPSGAYLKQLFAPQ